MDLGPREVDWLWEVTGLPVVVKGVLRVDDARALRRCRGTGGVDLGPRGRQLGQVVATAACVAPVRALVGERAQVYVDGEVRSGLHVLLALSLGADAAGELGDELVEPMRLAGCSTTAAAPEIACPGRGFPH